MRYFELAPGKYSRGLPFDSDSYDFNSQKMVNRTIFVRKIPLEMSPQSLEEHFSKYGDIKSAKIALNSDHSSKGFG